MSSGVSPPQLPDHGDQGAGAAGAAGRRAVARGGVANLAGAGFAGLAGLGVTWLVARGLGPVHAGAFFTATAAFVLAGGVAKLGAPTSLVYWPARLRARDEPHLLGACLRIGLTPVAAAGLVTGAALWLAAPWLAATAGDAAVATLVRALAGFLPLAVLADALLSASRGYRSMRPTVVLDRIARPALQLAGIGALALAAWWTPVPLAAYPLAWAVPYLPVALLAGYLLRRIHAAATAPMTVGSPANSRGEPPRSPGTRQRRAALRRLRRDFWRFTGPRALASVAQLALQRLDVLLVAALGGLGAAALYAVAGRFVVLGQLANQGVSQAVQPRLAEALATGDRARANDLYRTATGWLVLTTWPLYLTVMTFAPLYLALFGDAYRAGAPVVAVLSGAMLLATACGMVDMVLAMGGRTAWNLINVAVALAVTITLDILLIPRWGALGAAVGLACALAVNNLLPLAQVVGALRVHPFGRGTLTAAALALTCFGALPAGAVALAGRTPTALLGSVGAGGVLYLAGAAALRRPLALDALLTASSGRAARPAPDRATPPAPDPDRATPPEPAKET